MRKIELLCLEQIGEDLCLVFKTDEYKSRGILGKIDPEKLQRFSESAKTASIMYKKRKDGNFNANLID